ncbi:hypothetical protein [Georgenia thermotolerans]|uniref:PIN domain-containing protein n=1 Tax=Georgenia thermotolerans TaxID=527326 RepID=A0A7J5UIS8_9MICO|nr:hypothetical protein [Georgenia thermotolerans]KAE8762289.1 hypothetical protein GB883_20140 [Georgenia thermotolerans]
MTDFGTVYVVDTNTLSQLGRRRRAGTFFLEKARIPSEVLHEADQFHDLQALQGLEHPTTPSVLQWLTRVMATVPMDDTRLVDLYANRGGADPLVVACALDGRDRERQYLNPQEWAVVTADNAVRAKAEEFGLRVLSNTEFAALIDTAEDSGTPE